MKMGVTENVTLEVGVPVLAGVRVGYPVLVLVRGQGQLWGG